MIKSLYIRIVLVFLTIIIVGLVSSLLIGLVLFQKDLNQTGQNDMVAAGKEIARLIARDKPVDRKLFMESMTRLTSYPFQLVDETGVMELYGFDNREAAVTIRPESIRMVLEGKHYRSSKNEDDTFIGVPLDSGGKRYALFVQSSSKNESTIFRLLFTILLLVLVLGCLGILISARYIVKPLKTMTTATKRLAKGNFDVELTLKRKDELGILAQSINEMAIELKQLEQMRQDFVSNVSHEIQSPLTAISGFAKVLMNDKLILGHDRVKYLGYIVSESKRLSRLSDNLLQLASLESEHHPFKAARFNLDEQIRQVVVACEPLWSSKRIDMDLALSAALPISADYDQLHQVWVNLIGNSIKFTPEGGKVRIEMAGNNHLVTVTVHDSGCGISEEQQARIFERFYKADRSRNRSNEGNGLGLAIVKKIVDLHGGTIEVSSIIGQGTAVTINLPAE
ncbi:HAMP domain-containing sensor histidine kinase [Bacillus sp. FJAT-26390]|uniref:sensor histidine kinase n=1 Tax=Bacillus sp. FJAT-26390 TaxID=1743142 RepID=UPI000807E5EB|nr:HAMP domain-containing sensor histidine kinase [Bacillus sp. FJAT-26390]OBZ16457.1 two-component sensor histidine kinase [Bacillus sp. FJAT-26390]